MTSSSSSSRDVIKLDTDSYFEVPYGVIRMAVRRRGRLRLSSTKLASSASSIDRSDALTTVLQAPLLKQHGCKRCLRSRMRSSIAVPSASAARASLIRARHARAATRSYLPPCPFPRPLLQRPHLKSHRYASFVSIASLTSAHSVASRWKPPCNLSSSREPLPIACTTPSPSLASLSLHSILDGSV